MADTHTLILLVSIPSWAVLKRGISWPIHSKFIAFCSHWPNRTSVSESRRLMTGAISMRVEGTNTTVTLG